MFRFALFAAANGSSSDAVVGLLAALSGLGIFIAVAVYVLSKLRRGPVERAPSAQNDLVKFGALYESGELTKEEFSQIKRAFAAALDAEIEAKKAAAAASNGGADERRARLNSLLRNERR